MNKDKEEDILFAYDEIDYNKYINRLDYRYFSKDQEITREDLLPVVSSYDIDLPDKEDK